MQFNNIIACAALLCSAGAGLAQPNDASQWQPVDDALLAEARGGFEMGGGLVMSLGIERVVSINGDVTSSSAFNIADLSKLNAEQAGLADTQLSSLNLLQNGAGNSFMATLPQTVGATVIQNSLNDQVLATRTIINTSVNSSELLKTINFQDSLRTALSNSVGPQ
jgi:UDP-N-acetylenolpyruvoylglucosamine reductase